MKPLHHFFLAIFLFIQLDSFPQFSFQQTNDPHAVGNAWNRFSFTWNSTSPIDFPIAGDNVEWNFIDLSIDDSPSYNENYYEIVTTNQCPCGAEMPPSDMCKRFVPAGLSDGQWRHFFYQVLAATIEEVGEGFPSETGGACVVHDFPEAGIPSPFQYGEYYDSFENAYTIRHKVSYAGHGQFQSMSYGIAQDAALLVDSVFDFTEEDSSVVYRWYQWFPEWDNRYFEIANYQSYEFSNGETEYYFSEHTYGLVLGIGAPSLSSENPMQCIQMGDKIYIKKKSNERGLLQLCNNSGQMLYENSFDFGDVWIDFQLQSGLYHAGFFDDFGTPKFSQTFYFAN